MKATKHLSIQIDNENEVGVLRINIANFSKDNKKLETEIEALVKDKLSEALSAHFDGTVTKFDSFVISSVVPLSITVKVEIDSEFLEVVELEETWVY
jgi:hypothetical protein